MTGPYRLRRGTPDDTEACVRILVAAVTDLGRRQGTSWEADPAELRVRLGSMLDHLAEHAAEWWVAEDAERRRPDRLRPLHRARRPVRAHRVLRPSRAPGRGPRRGPAGPRLSRRARRGARHHRHHRPAGAVALLPRRDRGAVPDRVARGRRAPAARPVASGVDAGTRDPRRHRGPAPHRRRRPRVRPRRRVHVAPRGPRGLAASS